MTNIKELTEEANVKELTVKEINDKEIKDKEIKDTPNVSIIVLVDEFKELISLFNNTYHSIDYPQEKLEWIIIDDSNENNMDLFPLEENILYFHMDDSKEYLDKIEFKEESSGLQKNLMGQEESNVENVDEGDKSVTNYFKKTNTLPNGFKRDYGVGLSSHDYILHLDVDCYYNPKVLRRKLKFLQKNRLDCVFCDSMLCGFDNKIYKTENILRAFESTLFHTREFWKKSGFKWEDVKNEGDAFHYNKGNDRKMDNYYDTIKFIGMNNVNNYQYKEVKVDGIEFDYPEIFNSIKINENNIQYKLNKLFKDKFNILGLNSQIIKNFNQDSENILIEKKEKEKVILKKIKEFNKDFNVLIFNYKTEIWTIFKEINFDVILFETDKNFTSMKEILEKNDYVYYENIFIHKNYLIN